MHACITFKRSGFVSGKSGSESSLEINNNTCLVSLE